MNPPEQFYWRGWDCDSFFDEGVQKVMMRFHPYRSECIGKPQHEAREGSVCWDSVSKRLYRQTSFNGAGGWEELSDTAPAFHDIWGFPVGAWKALDQFRIANKFDDFQLFDFDLLAYLKRSPMWFFELGNAVFQWKNERAKRFNEANRDRKNADIKTAVEYWYYQRPVHGDVKIIDGNIRYEEFPAPEKWDVVVLELHNLGFGRGITNEALRNCVKREDDRRRKISDLWAQGFASALNCKVEANVVAGEAYKAYCAGPRDRKR